MYASECLNFEPCLVLHISRKWQCKNVVAHKNQYDHACVSRSGSYGPAVCAHIATALTASFLPTNHPATV